MSSISPRSTTSPRAAIGAPSRPQPLAAELRVAVMHVARRLRLERSEASLSGGQFSVLAHLDRCGPATPGELAEREHVQPPTMTRTVSALVEAGLVSRAVHPQDRRQVLLAVTAQGRAVVTATRRRRDEWLTRRLAALDPDEREVLARATDILTRIAAS